MTADKRADILSLARKTIHTEALALKHLNRRWAMTSCALSNLSCTAGASSW